MVELKEETKCLANLSFKEEEHPSGESPPRIPAENIARRYQLDVLERAKKGNTIVCLETGCGKTLIAVLLLKALSNALSSQQQSVSVFLVPTVNLVQQQGNVIESYSDLKVGRYTGQNETGRWHLPKWEEDINSFEVLVMTPQILLDNLRHSLMKMEMIKLLIFDECHHCQKGHPYARIMEEFYHGVEISARPRIFGMTASPVIRKGKSEWQFVQEINSLERMLDAKIWTLADKEELEAVVSSPKFEFREYEPVNDADDRLQLYIQTLHNLMTKHSTSPIEASKEFTKEGMVQNNDFWKKKMKVIAKIHRDLEYCIYDLGLWCARHAAEILIGGDESHLAQGSEKRSKTTPNGDKDSYLRETLSFLNSSMPGGGTDLDLESLNPDLVSSKVATLIDVLSKYRGSDFKCIVFVERKIAAKVLATLLCHCLTFLRCKFVTGSHTATNNVSRALMRKTLDGFRSGRINVLVATNVAEEGLDIQDCGLVVQFDLPKTVRSLIQSRGRARQPGSYYVVLKERGNAMQHNLLANLIESEVFMQKQVLCGVEAPLELYPTEHLGVEKFKVDCTGATVTTNNSVALLHHYCSKLPGDEFYHPAPGFLFFSVTDGIECQVLLPRNAPVWRVVGDPCASSSMAKKDACLKACKILHSRGALTDYLLPLTKVTGDEEEVPHLPGSNRESSSVCDAELQETVIPNVFLNQHENVSGDISVNSYMIKFHPMPHDRTYANFALFLQSPLPKEAANINVKLHLAHGRIVKSQLVPAGEVVFDHLQVIQAERFQSVLFSLLLDHEVVHPVPTGVFPKYGRWYLLLPLIQTHDSKTSQDLQIDWKTVEKVLSRGDLNSTSLYNVVHSSDAAFPSSSSALHFADGLVDTMAVPGSLVKTTHSNILYCIIEILHDLNGNSSFSNHSYGSYAEYFKHTYDVEMLHKEQPLLKAKPLRHAHNLLSDRLSTKAGLKERKEMLLELPPELCCVQIWGLYDGLINSAALLPSFMHRLENILVAVQLRDALCTRFSEGSRVSVDTVLEALTTQKCMEPFSLERLELLGDSFLKYAISCHLFLVHDRSDEGYLTSERILRISNASLYRRGTNHGLSGYIRDGLFRPEQWVAPGHPSKVICDESNIVDLHGESSESVDGSRQNVTCNKGHRWMQRKTIADVVEALIGAYLVEGGPTVALAFMRCIDFEVALDSDQISSICASSKDNLSLIERFNIKKVEKVLGGYTFRHKGLLLEAFTHASFTEHPGTCYQRLEFLGDSVLDYLITRYLYEKFRDLKPGQLTDLRSATVNNEKFARVAVQHDLHCHLIENNPDLSQHIKKFVSDVQNAEDGFLGDEWDGEKCPKVLGDIVESLAGAVFVDTGFDMDIVWKVFEPILQPIVNTESLRLHPVRELQELCQRNHFHLVFEPTDTGCTKFEVKVEVHVNDKMIVGAAEAKDKKSAKRQAARDALSKLKNCGYVHSHQNLISSLKSSNSKKVKPADKIQECPAYVQESLKASVSEEFVNGNPVYPGKLNLSTSSLPADSKPSSVLHSSDMIDTMIEHNQEKDTALRVLGGSNGADLHYEKLSTRLEDSDRKITSDSSQFEIEEETKATTSSLDISLLDSLASTSTKTGNHKQTRLEEKVCEQKQSSKARLTAFSQPVLIQDYREVSGLERTMPPFINLSLNHTLRSTEADTMDHEMLTPGPEDNSGKMMSDRSQSETKEEVENRISSPDIYIQDTRASTSRTMDHGKLATGLEDNSGKMMSDRSQSEIKEEGKNRVCSPDIYILDTRTSTSRNHEQTRMEEMPCRQNFGSEARVTAIPKTNSKGEVGELEKLLHQFAKVSSNHRSFKEATTIERSASYGLHDGFQFEITSEYSQGQARADLYEACAKQGWKDPTFTCCKDEGVPHNRMFTYTVTVQLPGLGRVECEGDPRKSKKSAMDSAAMELLTGLKRICYL